MCEKVKNKRWVRFLSCKNRITTLELEVERTPDSAFLCPVFQNLSTVPPQEKFPPVIFSSFWVSRFLCVYLFIYFFHSNRPKREECIRHLKMNECVWNSDTGFGYWRPSEILLLLLNTFSLVVFVLFRLTENCRQINDSYQVILTDHDITIADLSSGESMFFHSEESLASISPAVLCLQRSSTYVNKRELKV